MSTPLRQKLIEDMQLHGLSNRTQEVYVVAMRQLDDHYGKSPDQISEEELRQYFLYLSQVRKVSPSTFQIALSAIKFFFEYTLQRMARPGCLPARNSCSQSRPFRAKMRQALQKIDAAGRIPVQVWRQNWVVHCKPVGNGQLALKYLAPYIFRVAISNRRILKLEDERVTFRYRATDTGQERLCTLAAEEFIRRFLQHVLPKGFVKVRYYGFFSSGSRLHLAAIRQQLGQEPVQIDEAQPDQGGNAHQFSSRAW